MSDDQNRGGRKRTKRRRRRKFSSGSGQPPNIGSVTTPTRANIPMPIRTDGSINPFALFCALHLGIGPDDNYQPMGVPGVARRFGLEPRIIRESLRAYALDNESLRRIEYDLALARLDTRVVPDGMSRTDQARGDWKDFLEAAGEIRNWEQILSVPDETEDDSAEDEDADQVEALASIDADDSDDSDDSDEPEAEAPTPEQGTPAPEQGTPAPDRAGETAQEASPPPEDASGEGDAQPQDAQETAEADAEKPAAAAPKRRRSTKAAGSGDAAEEPAKPRRRRRNNSAASKEGEGETQPA
jgi:hypothetical protein